MDDAALVAGALAGDRDAFAAIYDRYHVSVYRFARMMSGSQTLAEDVTQEVFMLLMRDLSRYEPARSALGTYLYGVARNVTRARLRRDRRFVNLEDARETAGADDPALAVESFQERASVRRAIRRLPSRYREVVILCAIHGLSYAEAAAALQTPVGTIRSRLNRGKQVLATQLLRERNRSAPLDRAARCVV
jgi:RNA polymerase sigma-70 factor (ECF subfamily)